VYEPAERAGVSWSAGRNGPAGLERRLAARQPAICVHGLRRIGSKVAVNGSRRIGAELAVTVHAASASKRCVAIGSFDVSEVAVISWHYLLIEKHLLDIVSALNFAGRLLACHAPIRYCDDIAGFSAGLRGGADE
jgi:hypothetical protein